ncbi:MAG: hypothetical protein ACREMY_15015, partial [bacterium]
SQAWIYKWDNSHLALLMPVKRHHDVESDIFDPMFVDVDGDGALDVVDFRRGNIGGDDEESPASNSYRLLSLRDGELRVVSPLDLVFATVRNAGPPAPVTEPFSVSNPGAGRVLVLVNGDAQGKHRVSSAVVTVNGQDLITERTLNQGIARVEVPVVLKQDNTITAKLTGAPAGQILIVIMRR